MSAHRSVCVLHQADVAEKGLEQRATLVAHAQPAHERRAGGVRDCGHGAWRLGNDRGATLGGTKAQRVGYKPRRGARVGNHERGEVVAEQALDEPLHRGVGVNKVGQAALEPLASEVRELGHERARALHVRINGPKGVERCLRR